MFRLLVTSSASSIISFVCRFRWAFPTQPNVRSYNHILYAPYAVKASLFGSRAAYLNIVHAMNGIFPGYAIEMYARSCS